MSEPSQSGSSGAVGEPGLAIQRNAVRGFAAGAVFAVAVFVVFALLPGTTRPLGLYIALAFVLGVSIGLLATVLLVGWRFYRLSRQL